MPTASILCFAGAALGGLSLALNARARRVGAAELIAGSGARSVTAMCCFVAAVAVIGAGVSLF